MSAGFGYENQIPSFHRAPLRASAILSRERESTRSARDCFAFAVLVHLRDPPALPLCWRGNCCPTFWSRTYRPVCVRVVVCPCPVLVGRLRGRRAIGPGHACALGRPVRVRLYATDT